MATLGYSSFFSSGLLATESDAAHGSRPHTPDPSTPRPKTTSLDDTTPTAATHTIPAAAQNAEDVLPILAQAIEINDSPSVQASERPRMRRRRSSLGLAASPVAPLKSNTAGARASISVHVQRQSMGITGMASTRSRSGSIVDSGMPLSRAAMSIAMNDATSGNSIVGRLRSGSVGTALRPRRLRKQATLPAPLPPPPTTSLPELPPLPSYGLPAIPQTPRRPSARRTLTSDSIPLPIHTPTMHGSSPIFHAMDIDYDYPRPLDTPGRVRGGYF
ncbi:hypothetical protein BDW22DRAFT_456179 [Trametopsis cervina]|nr:hypothetical protein BDW22DRAFT_456179 [Trametopsis cervina]